MKKIISIGLSLIIIAALAVTAFAAGNVTFTMNAPDETLSAGDEVTLTASCTANTEATSYGLMLKYDENVFEYVSGTVTVENTLVKSMGAGTAHGFVFMFQEATAYSGTVGTAVLKVKESAPAGSYTITGNASVKNGADTVEAADCSVTVTVSKESVSQESQPAEVTEPAEVVTEPIPTKPVLDLPAPSVPVTDKPEESVPTTGTPVESVPTTGEEILVEEKEFPSWIFLVAAGVIAVVGVAAVVIIKKKK